MYSTVKDSVLSKLNTFKLVLLRILLYTLYIWGRLLHETGIGILFFYEYLTIKWGLGTYLEEDGD
jgi:hypothetical protein